jgi:hypothetical protein
MVSLQKLLSVKGSSRKSKLLRILKLNRSRKDWHRQFLSGTTVFVQKTVPKETVRAFDYRT